MVRRLWLEILKVRKNRRVFTPQLNRLDRASILTIPYLYRVTRELAPLLLCSLNQISGKLFETTPKLATIMSSATMEAVQPYAMEHDPRWTAVDAYQFSHLFPESRPYHAALVRAQSNSIAHGLRDISVSPSQGRYLAIQCQLIGAKYVLEMGTLGAYSTIWMASADPSIKVTTIEIDPRTAEIARENIRFAGLEGRVDVILGAALDVLPRLMEEVDQGRRPRFDFSFVDADKENALMYFDWAVKLSRARAAIYVDNVVRKGLLADMEAAKMDTRVQGVRKAVEGVGRDERVNAVVVQTVGEKNYDGFLLAIVK